MNSREVKSCPGTFSILRRGESSHTDRFPTSWFMSTDYQDIKISKNLNVEKTYDLSSKTISFGHMKEKEYVYHGWIHNTKRNVVAEWLLLWTGIKVSNIFIIFWRLIPTVCSWPRWPIWPASQVFTSLNGWGWSCRIRQTSLKVQTHKAPEKGLTFWTVMSRTLARKEKSSMHTGCLKKDGSTNSMLHIFGVFSYVH